MRRRMPSGFCVGYPVFSLPVGETMVCHQTSVGSLPRSRLLGGDKTRGHVRLAVDLGGIEVVRLRVFHIDKDVVVLGRPAALGPCPVVVGPDDLVQERLAAEDRIEHDLGVVHLAVVEVHVQRAIVGQQPPGLTQARLQERPVVIERVVVAVQVPAQRR